VTSLFGENNVSSVETEKIHKGIVESAVKSLHTRSSGTLAFGSGACKNLAFQRRYAMRDGSVEMHPHKDDPNLVGPEGPEDPEIGVLVVLDENGDPAAAVSNFSCHLTSLERDNRKFSADFPAFAEQYLRKQLENEDFILLYLNGPCGNVCQVDVMNRDAREVGIEHTKKMGRMFAESVQAAMGHVEPAVEDLSIRTCYQEIEIPIREITGDMLKKARETVKRYEGKKLRVKNLSNYGIESHRDNSVISAQKFLETEFWKNAAACELLLLHEKYGDNGCETVPLTVASIGTNLLVTVPAEFFVEFSLELKEKLKNGYGTVLIAELVNGWVGYVPTRRAFEPEKGGYEVQFLNSSKLAENAGEIIVDKLLQMERALHT
jgi:hypothetical protein